MSKSRIRFRSYAATAARIPGTNELVMVKFLRSDVERCKFEEFIRAFDADRMNPQRLRGFMGKCLFALEGYDDDPRELAMIPEARAFYRLFTPRGLIGSFSPCLMKRT